MFDAIILGSGPAGVSAAFPLVKSGRKVLMIDGGYRIGNDIPREPYSTWRTSNDNQLNRFFGNNYSALLSPNASSPKLRIPNFGDVFKNYLQENCISPNNYSVVGSLASGGLSNAWGCGISKYSRQELSFFPCSPDEINASYDQVCERIGISGNLNDDLFEYFGFGNLGKKSIELDELNNYLLLKYREQDFSSNSGFKLGKSRVAAISEDLENRKACNLCGNCLWGCSRKSLYSASDEIEKLKQFSNFYYLPGIIVSSIGSSGFKTIVFGKDKDRDQTLSFESKTILLGLGTIAFTRIVLNALEIINFPLRLLSSRSGACLLFLPKFIGKANDCRSFGAGQLAYHLKVNSNVSIFGSTLTTVGIPIYELLFRTPFQAPFSLNFFKGFIRSCLVLNFFYPGSLSHTHVYLDSLRRLQIKHVEKEELASLAILTKKKLFTHFKKLNSFLVPKSFTLSDPGSDIHYCGTLPMKINPNLGETNRFGEIMGLKNVFSIDGACLPYLSEKPHTLTIMANADRIGKYVAEKI